jgi:PKD repeat protein
LLVGFNTKAQVIANFSMSDSISCYRGFQFTDMSTPSGLPLKWEFGDGSTVITTNQIVWHNYNYAGIYAVKLIATNGIFSDSIVKNITILELPFSNFSYSPINPTTNDTVQFTNFSTNANTYYWNFNYFNSIDTSSSTLENPKHLYDTAGTYYVTLYAINDSIPFPLSCLDSMLKQIIVINPISVEEFLNDIVSEPFPNPTNNEFQINYSITNTNEESSLYMYNNQGQKVKAIKLNPLLNTVNISVKELPSGIYYYEVCSKNSNHTNFRKLIISR